MSLRPVNSEAVLRELDRRTAGRGNGKKLAAMVDIEPPHLREMKCGRRQVNQKVAAVLGYELRWVKVNKDVSQEK